MRRWKVVLTLNAGRSPSGSFKRLTRRVFYVRAHAQAEAEAFAHAALRLLERRELTLDDVVLTTLLRKEARKGRGERVMQARTLSRRTAADVVHLERKLAEARDHATILGRSAVYWMHDARRALSLGQTSVAFTSVLLALQDRILAREWRGEVRFIRQRIREVTS